MTENNMTKTATFAGGCFWCIEEAFANLPGVISTKSGLTGGHTEHPTYEDVHRGDTGHREAVEVVFDPGRVSYEKLVKHYFYQIDPTDPGGQFVDRGHAYTTAIYYHDPEQQATAEKLKSDLEKSGKFNGPIVTEVLPAKKFYDAEEYHQEYWKKHPERYKMYKLSSGRSEFLKKNWGTLAHT